MDFSIIVAIDFGTTYSGAAWVGTNDRSSPLNVLQKWPGRFEPKVVTELEYGLDGKLRDWGYTIDPHTKDGLPIFWFKDLLPIHNLEHQREALKVVLPNLPEGEFSARTLVRDFIGELYKYIVKQLQADGQIKPGESVTSCLEFVITFPACWTYQSLAEYKLALSGTPLGEFMEMDKVHFLREPEAAIIGTLHSQKRALVGSKYKRAMILDIGGGTLDFSAYDVLNWNPLSLNEVFIDGCRLGGSNVDKNFWKWFNEKLASKGHDMTGLPSAIARRLLREFEILKRSFPSTNVAFYHLTLPQHPLIPTGPSSEKIGIKNGRLTITRAEMESFFKPVVDEVLGFLNRMEKTIREEKHWHPSAFFLVGGFADCEYLKDRVANWVKKLPQDTTIFTPSNSWTAIVTGAAKYGQDLALKQEGPVKSRVFPYHVGIVKSVPFDSHKHAPKDKIKAPGGRGKLAKDQIEWLLPKGSQIRKTLRVQMEKTFNHWPCDCKDTLVLCESNEPPSSLAAFADIKKFGEVTSNLEAIPEAERIKSYKFLRFGKYYNLQYELELTFRSADLLIETIYHRKKYGRANIDYKGHLEQLSELDWPAMEEDDSSF